jgi:hypothetical protein
VPDATTLTAVSAAAQRLHGILGFREIAAYYENPIPGTRYMELDLRSPT